MVSFPYVSEITPVVSLMCMSEIRLVWFLSHLCQRSDLYGFSPTYVRDQTCMVSLPSMSEITSCMVSLPHKSEIRLVWFLSHLCQRSHLHGFPHVYVRSHLVYLVCIRDHIKTGLYLKDTAYRLVSHKGASDGGT